MNRASQTLKRLTERHNRQRDVKVRAFGREIDRWTAQMEQRLLGIVAANRGGMAGVLGSVDAYLIGELAGAAETMHRGLMSIATWAWQSATANWVHALPLSFWLRRNLPVKTLVGIEGLRDCGISSPQSPNPQDPQIPLLEYAGDLDAQNQLQRILDGLVDREEAMEIIRQVEFGRPSIEEFEAIVNDVAWPDGLDAMSRIKTVKPAELEQLRSVIRRYLTEVDTGAAWQSMTAEIKPLVGNVNYKAKRIARTESVRVAEDMQRKAFFEAEDLIQGIRTFTADDRKVRETHRHWHDKLFYKTSDGYIARDGERLPRFPAGANCRCWDTPELIDDLTVGLPAEDLGAGYRAGLDRFKRQQAELPKAKPAPKRKPKAPPQPAPVIKRKAPAPAPRVEPKKKKRKPTPAPQVKRPTPPKKAAPKKPIVPRRKRGMAKAEAEIVGRDKETGVVFDKEGKELFRRTGGKDRIEFSSEEAKRLRGATLTHNHPPVKSVVSGAVIENLPLSGADGFMLAEHGLDEIRAVTKHYAFSLKPKPGAALNGKKINAAWRRRDKVHDRKEMARLGELVAKGEMERQEANRLGFLYQQESQHKAWEDIAEKQGLEYRRQKRGE